MALREEMQLVIHYAEPCRACGPSSRISAPIQIDVTSAEVHHKAWAVKGRGSFSATCPQCGMQVAIVKELIPVQCDGLVCPKCGKPEHLAIKMTKLDKSEQSFEFEALIECRRCNRTNVLKRILEKVTGLLSIEVGLTGITVKAKPKEA